MPKPELARAALCALLLCLAPSAWGKPQALPITSEMEGVFLGPSIELRWGKEGESLQEAQAATDYEYQGKDVPGWGLSSGLSVAWARFELINPSDQPISIYIQNFSPSRVLTLFQTRDDGSHLEMSMGEDVNGGNYSIRYRTPIFEIDVPPGRSTWYLRQKYTAQHFDLRVWTERPFLNAKLMEYALLGGLFMVLAVMIVYNLILFLVFRQRYYIFYVLYLLSYACMENSLLRFPGVYLHPWIDGLANGVAVWFGLTMLCSILFCRTFLDTAQSLPRFDKILLFLASLCILHSATSAFIWGSYRYTMMPLMLGPPLMISIALIRSWQGFRPARFYLLGWSTFAVGSTLYFLNLNYGIGAGSFLGTWLVRVSVVVEAVLFSLALADKVHKQDVDSRNQILSLNEQLRHQIHNIEAIVSEKTRKIGSILANIKMGIFTIKSGGLIDDEYSKHLEKLTNESKIAGEHAVHFLSRNSSLTSDECSQINSALIGSLGEEELTFQVNQSVFPREMRQLDEQGQERIIESDWIPMLNSDALIERILVVLRDVTENRQLRRLNQKQEERLVRMAELVDIAPMAFDRFMNHAEICLASGQRLLDPQQQNHAQINQVFIDWHSLKGLSRNMNLRILTDAIHQFECLLSRMRDEKAPVEGALLEGRFLTVKSLLLSYKNFQRAPIDRLVHKDQIVLSRSLAASLLDALETVARTVPAPMIRQLSQMRDAIERACFTDTLGLVNEMSEMASRLARELDKADPLILVEGADAVRLTPDQDLLLRDIFLHLVRNSLDHGIESRDERFLKGKSERGTIRMVWQRSSLGVQIDISDDGKGLRIEHIRAQALRRALIQDAGALSESEIASLIFLPGLSTAEQISDISGRGVGMTAVRKLIEENAGSIELLLQDANDFDKHPFSLRIFLPFSVQRDQAA